MRKTIPHFIFLFLILALTGCASLKSMVPFSNGNNKKAADPLPLYSGPKAKIAVADFEIKAAKVTTEVSSALREMLVNTLEDSNRFILVEPQEQKAAAASTDLIVTAAITEFEPQSSGGKAGVGGGGGAASGTLGGLLGNASNKARISLEVKIADTATSKVLANTRVQGQTSSNKANAAPKLYDRLVLKGGLSAYANTPMEKAIDACIVDTTRYISGAIPKEYYKY